MDLLTQPHLPNPFAEHVKVNGEKQQAISAWIDAHAAEIFTAKIIRDSFPQGCCPLQNVRELLRRLEKEDVLVRIGYGMYVTKRHYDAVLAQAQAPATDILT